MRGVGRVQEERREVTTPVVGEDWLLVCSRFAMILLTALYSLLSSIIKER